MALRALLALCGLSISDASAMFADQSGDSISQALVEASLFEDLEREKECQCNEYGKNPVQMLNLEREAVINGTFWGAVMCGSTSSQELVNLNRSAAFQKCQEKRGQPDLRVGGETDEDKGKCSCCDVHCLDTTDSDAACRGGMSADTCATQQCETNSPETDNNRKLTFTGARACSCMCEEKSSPYNWWTYKESCEAVAPNKAARCGCCKCGGSSSGTLFGQDIECIDGAGGRQNVCEAASFGHHGVFHKDTCKCMCQTPDKTDKDCDATKRHCVNDLGYGWADCRTCDCVCPPQSGSPTTSCPAANYPNTGVTVTQAKITCESGFTNRIWETESGSDKGLCNCRCAVGDYKDKNVWDAAKSCCECGGVHKKKSEGSTEYDTCTCMCPESSTSAGMSVPEARAACAAKSGIFTDCTSGATAASLCDCRCAESSSSPDDTSTCPGSPGVDAVLAGKTLAQAEQICKGGEKGETFPFFHKDKLWVGDGGICKCMCPPKPTTYPNDFQELFNGKCSGNGATTSHDAGAKSRQECQNMCKQNPECLAVEVSGCLKDVTDCGESCKWFSGTEGGNIENGMPTAEATGHEKCYRNCANKKGCTQPVIDYQSQSLSEVAGDIGFVQCKKHECDTTMQGVFRVDSCQCCPTEAKHQQTACYPNPTWKTEEILPLMAPQTSVDQKCMWSPTEGKCKDYCSTNGGEYKNQFSCTCPGKPDTLLFEKIKKCKHDSGGCGMLDPTQCECVCKEQSNPTWPKFADARTYCNERRQGTFNCNNCSCTCDEHNGIWHGQLTNSDGVKTIQQADIACHGQKFFDNGWIRTKKKEDGKTICMCEALPTEPCCPDDLLDGELRGRLVNSQALVICQQRNGTYIGEKKQCCCSVGPNGEKRTDQGQCGRVGHPAQQGQQQQQQGNSTTTTSGDKGSTPAPAPSGDKGSGTDTGSSGDKGSAPAPAPAPSGDKGSGTDTGSSGDKGSDTAPGSSSSPVASDLQQKKSDKKDKKKNDQKEDDKKKDDKKKDFLSADEQQQELERQQDTISELRTDVKALVEEIA